MKDVEVDLKSNAIENINCHSCESATFERSLSQKKLVKNRDNRTTIYKHYVTYSK